MEGRGDVRVHSEQATDLRRSRVAPVAAATLLLGVLVGVSGFRGSDATAPGDDLPDLGPDPLETAQLVVGDFAVAWNDGDLGALDRLVADEWGSIVLPGFLDPRFVGTRDELRDAVAFLTSVATLSLGPCDSEPAPPDGNATALVRCAEAGFSGDYLDALRLDFRVDPVVLADSEPIPGITFEIRDDRIIDLDTHAQDFAPQAYCAWAQGVDAALAASLFDLYCYPTTTGANGTAHAEAATRFMAAGAPLPSPETVEARYVASYVDRFVENLNLGAPYAVLRWLSGGVGTAALPGYAGAAEEPFIADYLEWVSILFEIETGQCSVGFEAGSTVVTCPDLTVAGPLLEESHPQPTRFTLVDSVTRETWGQPFERIVAVERLTEDLVPVAEVCRRVQRLRPSVAAQAFTDDCLPVYKRTAAETLATVLELWRDSPNRPPDQIGLDIGIGLPTP
jgi:hypothetical protein